MATVDLKKSYQGHYSGSVGVAVLAHVPERPYLMIDGAGDPNTSAAYREALEAIDPLAYGLRASINEATGDAYVVMPLEGLWWADDWQSFRLDDRSNWLWTAMICLPDAVADVDPEEVMAPIVEKKRLAAGPSARVERFGDGTAAQILHVGPDADEAPTIATLHRFVDDHGYVLAGRDHETLP